jgi:2'-5' RNA ligase
MADFHSVWLMPRAEDEARLAAIIEELAVAFCAPRFRPHLTLVEDNAMDPARLSGLVADLGCGLPAFDAPINGIGASALYYRSLFARFAAEGPLLELKRRAIETIAPSPLVDFMPHVSLLYGAPDTPQKRDAVAAVEGRLAGSSVHFDSVAMVRSAQSIPIAEWRVAAQFALGEPA